ncbi:hypothetical protein BT96DRAFT_823863, partial [Gymnopus androsaceus JB14]
AMGIQQTLHPGDYHVIAIAGKPFTTLTLLLPCKLLLLLVYTVQIRFLIELACLHGHYVSGKAVDISVHERLIEVETMGMGGKKQHVYILYVKSLLRCFCCSLPTPSTHGILGLENCFQLKTIGDAQLIRHRIINNFEGASLPTTSSKDCKHLFSFIVCGMPNRCRNCCGTCIQETGDPLDFFFVSSSKDNI